MVPQKPHILSFTSIPSSFFSDHCVKLHGWMCITFQMLLVVWHGIEYSICIHQVHPKQLKYHSKIEYLGEFNSLLLVENLTPYYLLMCRIVVNFIVWEISRGKLAAGNHALRIESCRRNVYRVILFNQWKLLYQIQNEIICKHRKLRLQLPWKDSSISGLTVIGQRHLLKINENATLVFSMSFNHGVVNQTFVFTSLSYIIYRIQKIHSFY